MEDNNQSATSSPTMQTNNPAGENKMPKKLMLYIVIALVVLLGIYAMIQVVRNRDRVTEVPGSTVTQGEWDPDADPNVDRPVVEVSVSEDGFSPEELVIEAGSVVVWTNNSGETVSINSSPHPDHTDYPLLNLGELASGDKFSLLFETPGEYMYHNHLNPDQTGSITVDEATSVAAEE